MPYIELKCMDLQLKADWNSSQHCTGCCYTKWSE